jgi:hypothetical protein
MPLASNATLAESPMDILLWTFPLKSHLRMLLKLTLRPSSSAPPRTCAARRAAIDHELPTGHIAGCGRGEEEHTVGDVLGLSCPAERHPGFGHLVRVNRRIVLPEEAGNLVQIGVSMTPG